MREKLELSYTEPLKPIAFGTLDCKRLDWPGDTRGWFRLNAVKRLLLLSTACQQDTLNPKP